MLRILFFEILVEMIRCLLWKMYMIVTSLYGILGLALVDGKPALATFDGRRTG